MSTEEARIVSILLEAETGEDLAYFVVPMLWATPQATQRAFEEPVFVLGSVWITRRRVYDSNLLGGENALAEGIFTVALFQTPFVLAHQ